MPYFHRKKRLILERGVFWQLPFQLLVYFLGYLRLIPLHKGWGTIFCMDQWVPTENPWNMASQKNLSLITYFRQFLSLTLKVISQWQWFILKHGNSLYCEFKTILKSERPQILVIMCVTLRHYALNLTCHDSVNVMKLGLFFYPADNW